MAGSQDPGDEGTCGNGFTGLRRRGRQASGSSPHGSDLAALPAPCVAGVESAASPPSGNPAESSVDARLRPPPRRPARAGRQGDLRRARWRRRWSSCPARPWSDLQPEAAAPAAAGEREAGRAGRGLRGVAEESPRTGRRGNDGWCACRCPFLSELVMDTGHDPGPGSTLQFSTGCRRRIQAARETLVQVGTLWGMYVPKAFAEDRADVHRRDDRVRGDRPRGHPDR